MSPINELPEEVCLHFLQFLEAFDLCRLRQVNRKFYRLADDPKLWKTLFRRNFVYDYPLLPDPQGIFSFLERANTRREEKNVWRESYKHLHGAVHVFPNNNISLSSVLGENPDALVLLHEGIHHIDRPLHLSGSPRIFGVARGPPANIQNRVGLDVKRGHSELCLLSSSCKAHLAFLTIGFKQIGRNRAPIFIKDGARPILYHCTLTNSSQLGWAAVISGPRAAPVFINCTLPDGTHNGMLVTESQCHFYDNEFGLCSGVCLELEASVSYFRSNWVRPGNRITVSDGQGSIGGVLLTGKRRLITIETNSNYPDSCSWRENEGWLHWSTWPPATT